MNEKINKKSVGIDSNKKKAKSLFNRFRSAPIGHKIQKEDAGHLQATKLPCLLMRILKNQF